MLMFLNNVALQYADMIWLPAKLIGILPAGSFPVAVDYSASPQNLELAH